MTFQNWKNAAVALTQGWWTPRFRTRSAIDFRLGTAQKNTLKAIALQDDVVNRLAAQLSLMPSKTAYLVAVWTPVAVGTFLYFATATVVSVWSAASTFESLLISLFCAVAFILPPLYRCVLLSWKWADAHVINSLLQVMEAAEQVAANPSRYSYRPQLIRRINRSAKVFIRAYPRPGGKLPRDSRAAIGQLASRGALALGAYAGQAPTGDEATLVALRDDFGRAVLRVSAGEWTQVAHLQSWEPQQDRLRRVRRTPPKEIVIALIGLVGLVAAPMASALVGK